MAQPRLRRHRRSGQALVEFAFCLPILLFVFAAIVDYGWCLFLQISLHEAVRDAALLAIYDGTYSAQQIQNRVITSMAPATLTTANVSVNLNSSMTIGGVSYRSYDIKATYTYNFLVLFVFYSNASLTLTSEQQSLIVPGFTP